MRLLVIQPPQRRHVQLLVDDVHLPDLRRDQVRHLPEPTEPQRADDPRHKIEPVRELDVGSSPPDAVDNHCQTGVDRDASLLRQVVENKTVLRDRDTTQERPVRKDRADLEERRCVVCQCNPRKHRDDEENRVDAEIEQESVPMVDAEDGEERSGG